MSFFLTAVAGNAQQEGIQSQSSITKAGYELSKSLEMEESDEEIAKGYEKTAKELTLLKDYRKAEGYLIRAKKIYEKRKNQEMIAFIERELAKVRELQNKPDEAIISYNAAANLSGDKLQQSLNINDAYRLINRADPATQVKYIQNNIDLLQQSGNKAEATLAFQQMAEANLELNNSSEAIHNLSNALESAGEKEEKIKITGEIAKVYAADLQLEKAININKKLVEEAAGIKNPKLQIQQLRSLSSNYFQGNEPDKGLISLQKAYELAVDKGQVLEAKESLELLVEKYKKNDPRKVLELYDDFIARLETLIRADSSLMDAGQFQAIEEKILRLERERLLKDELIRKKNIFNYVLIGSIALIFIFLLFLGRAFYTIKIRNKKIALQSLRREMNPHFIFNSLNSVNRFIAQNNETEANKYLSSYSKLMRNTMENSNKDFIPLSTELEHLEEYLELEHMRFRDKFDYRIEIDDSLDPDIIYVPNMLIQPQLENAIWHGLRYKEEKGTLLLNIFTNNDYLHICIEDNGIGLKKSNELKTAHQQAHHSRGLTNTRERIYLLNKLYHTRISMEITDKENQGVTVRIKFPLKKKN